MENKFLEELMIAVYKNNINIDSKTCEKLSKFKELMLEYNSKHNITSITDEKEIIYKHFIDSLNALDVMENNVKVLDIGCGGGFPSIPLALAKNTLNITAMDSVKKKTDFVNLVKNELKIDNLQVINDRIEEFIKKNNNRESYDYVLARAVAPLNTLLEYSIPYLKIGGKLIAFKGSNYQEELNNAKNAMKTLNCELAEIIDYRIEDIDRTNYIITIQKMDSTDNKYPRGQNKPRLNPLT